MEELSVCVNQFESRTEVIKPRERRTIDLKFKRVLKVRVFVLDDPLEHKFVSQVVEGIWLGSDLLKALAVPLFDDLLINFKGRASTSSIMLSNDQLEQASYEYLECDSLHDFSK